MNWHDRTKRTANFIAEVQLPSGAIPWFEGGKTDPWNHVEAAMGLSVAGRLVEAEAAYAWLARNQRSDGSWYANYDTDGAPLEERVESNFVAYIATGTWHHYLVTNNQAFLADYWPVITRAMNYIATLQAESGEIYWAEDVGVGVNQDALITGCSSIYKSLEATMSIASVLGERLDPWREMRANLGNALRNRPERFDRTWPSKSRFAMDWFYPVLCGAYDAQTGLARLRARHEEFVHPDHGCRCVVEEPWATIAETCELVMAYVTVGEIDIARRLFDQMSRYQAEDGSWWTGYQFAEKVLWPNERPTWTAGAVLLALDALEQHTPASRLFTLPPAALEYA